MIVKFGLKAQGHLPLIEETLESLPKYSSATWEDIGKDIGWCPLTAALQYFRHSEFEEYRLRGEDYELLVEPKYSESDIAHIDWLRSRLRNVHSVPNPEQLTLGEIHSELLLGGDRHNTDFMIRLRKIIGGKIEER